MPSGESFDATVQEMEECIETCDDDVVDLISNPDDQTQPIGFRAKHGGWLYTVYGVPSVDFFIIQFDFDIAANIGDVLSEDDAKEILSNPSTVSPAELPRTAGVAVMEQMNEESQTKFRYHLLSEIMTTDTAHGLDMTDGQAVTGYSIERRIYPDDGAFSVGEFSHSRQAVINAGIRGIQFVANSFDFDAIIEEIRSTESDVVLPYYQ